MNATKGIRARIKELAARPCGVSPAELAPEFDPTAVFKNGSKMMQLGQLFGAGFRDERRYFVALADAERYANDGVRLVKEEKAKQQRIKNAERSAMKRSNARARLTSEPKAPRPEVERKAKPVKEDNAPVKVRHYGRAPWKPDTEAIIPEGLTVQKLPGCPPVDLRYCVPPGKRIKGEFSKIPYGATLKDEQ